MGLFEKKYVGRGIRCILAFYPVLNEGELRMLGHIVKTSKLAQQFTHIDVSDYGKTKDGKWSTVKVYCLDAKFNVKLSEAEELYTKIFYDLFGLAGSFAGFSHKDLDIQEYSFLYRFVPKERPDEFMPIITLKTIGAFIFWRRLFAKSKREDITKAVPSKYRERLKEIVKDTPDARSMVAENRDFILDVAQKVGVFKPYRNVDELKPTIFKLGKKAQDAYKETVESSKGAVSYYHFMPILDDELELVNKAKDSL